MRSWRWHERPWVSTLCAAVAAAAISAAATMWSDSLWEAPLLGDAAGSRASLSFIDMSIHHLRLERLGAQALNPPVLRGVKDSQTSRYDGYLLKLAAGVLRVPLVPGLKPVRAHDALVAHLLTL